MHVLSDIIHADQTCGIHGRHIYDSIALSRDIIDSAKCDGIPMSIINIDQEKAFDTVSHEYLFRVLKACLDYVIEVCPVLLILMVVCVGL